MLCFLWLNMGISYITELQFIQLQNKMKLKTFNLPQEIEVETKI